MNRLIRTELLKVSTTRTSVLVVVAAMAFAGFLGFATAALAGREGNPPLGSADMVERVLGVSTIPAVVALLLGILLSAGEHQHGTITTSFLVTPQRWRVVVAKASAAAIVGPVVALLLVVAASVGAAPRVLTDGPSLHVDAGALGVVGGLVLAAAVLGLLGALLGLLVRSQVAAVVGVAAWALVVEGVVDTIAGGGLREWMPGGAAASLAGGGEQAAIVATGVLAAWAIVLAAITVPAVERRDVT